jgi:hypothetical protein
MTFGGVRHGGDIDAGHMDPRSSGVTNLQMGTNLGANQSGMNMGAQRHITNY